MSSLTLEQHRAIDRCKEQLVPAAEALLDEARGIEIGRDFGHSQLRNLIAVASETEAPAVVMNFIRYQIGRDFRASNWGKSVGDKTLGERFIDQLDKAGGAVASALEEIPGLAQDKERRQLARILLIRQFLGFASRHLKYLEFQRRGRR